MFELSKNNTVYFGSAVPAAGGGGSALPDQTGQSGKFLTTDGTDASWGAVPAPAGVYTEDNLVGGTNISIDDGVITGGIDANTLVMFHFNGDWTDSSQYASSASWYPGSAPSTATFPEGKFSEGVQGWPVSSTARYVNGAAFSTISHQCTIDFWAKIGTSNNGIAVHLGGGSNNGKITFGVSRYGFSSTNTGVSVYFTPHSNNAWITISNANIDVEGFNHYAVCFDDVKKQAKLFINGVYKYTETFSGTLGTFNATNSYVEPDNSATPGTSIVDEFRISNIVRWDSNFSVPTAPYDNSTRNVKKINNTMSEPSVMTGATSSAAGTSGLVPAPAAGDQAKYLTGAGTWATINALQNNSTGTNSLSILGQATTSKRSVSIGYNAHAETDYSIAIGESSYTDRETQSVAVGYVAAARSVNGIAIGTSASVGTSGSRSIAIGANSTSGGTKSIAIGGGDGYASSQGANAQGANSISIGHSSSTASNKSNTIAIGYWAQANQDYAIQLGTGTNSTANTFSVGLDNSHNYQMLDSNGQIPAARLGTGFDASKTQVLKNVNGVLTWVDEA